ncbi:hypothetical protein LLG88_02400 [bacterium]|nr:hypothetical protein [bacterium]
MTMAAGAKDATRGGRRGDDAAGRGSGVGRAGGAAGRGSGVGRAGGAAGRGSGVGRGNDGRAGEASGAARDDQRLGFAVAVALLLLFVAARLALRAFGGA